MTFFTLVFSIALCVVVGGIYDIVRAWRSSKSDDDAGDTPV